MKSLFLTIAVIALAACAKNEEAMPAADAPAAAEAPAMDSTAAADSTMTDSTMIDSTAKKDSI